MKYKLICTDLDGTLLNNERRISERDAQALKEAVKKGVNVAFSTGRLFSSARFYSYTIGLNPYIISSNGAYVRSLDEDNPMLNHNFTKSQFNKICSIIDKYNVEFVMNTYDTVITKVPLPSNNAHVIANKVAPPHLRVNIAVHRTLDDVYDTYNGQLLKSMFIFRNNPEIAPKIRQDLSDLGDLDLTSSSPFNLEIMPKGVSKFNGIETLCKYLNISPKEVLCFGDSENDLSMIENVGMGVAMGNATEDIKLKADYITDTNDNYGISKAIEKFILSDDTPSC